MIQAVNDKLVIKLPEKKKPGSNLVVPDGSEIEEKEDQACEVISVGHKVKTVAPGDTEDFPTV